MNLQVIWWLCMMIAYTLKERVCFKMNDLSSVLLIIYLQWLKKTTSAVVLQAKTPTQFTSHAANQWSFLAGILLPVEVLKAVIVQADWVFSFRTGKIASRLYDVTTGFLCDTSLATRDDSCCEFYPSSAQIPGVSSLSQVTLYGGALYLLVISMKLASRHPSDI
jgi:hypothetical protein